VFASHARRVSALGAAWVAGLLSWHSVAAEPFNARDQNPFLAGFGLPSAMPTRAAAGETRDWSGRLDLFWGSTALIQQSGPETLIVDAETREARLTLQAPLSERFAFQLQLPHRYTGAGNLDGFIDGWHDAFGLPDGARSDLPSDAINITYVRDQSSRLSVTSSASGLGDVQAALGYDVIAAQASALSAWLSVKLPTGDADKLTGSGATDISFILAGQRSLDEDWSVFGQASVTWLGDGDLLPYRQRSAVWSGLAGLSGRVWRGLSLKAQIDAHTAAFDSDLDFLNEAVVLTVGGDYTFASGWRMDIGVSEDIAVERSPDVVFLFGVKRDW
jgi:hypothetical protein